MSTEIDISKINFYSDSGVPPNSIGITKIVMYAIVSSNPPGPPPIDTTGARRWMAAIQAVRVED